MGEFSDHDENGNRLHRGEVLSPSDAERARLAADVAREEASSRIRSKRKWNALIHVLIIFLLSCVVAYGVILAAAVFGVYETMVGCGFVIASSIVGFVYIHNQG